MSHASDSHPAAAQAVQFETVSLPDPQSINNALAVVSAVYATLGRDDDLVFAAGPMRQAGSGSGDDWARLVFLPEGRAVLYGMEHGQARVYWEPGGEAPATGMDSAGWRTWVDLIHGAPEWWRDGLKDAVSELTFVYGFDGNEWTRRAHAFDDGFDNVVFPHTIEQVWQALADVFSEDKNDIGMFAPIVEDLIAAGPQLTEVLLEELCEEAWHSYQEFDPEASREDCFDKEPDYGAGVSAARAFVFDA